MGSFLINDKFVPVRTGEFRVPSLAEASSLRCPIIEYLVHVTLNALDMVFGHMLLFGMQPLSLRSDVLKIL